MMKTRSVPLRFASVGIAGALLVSLTACTQDKEPEVFVTPTPGQSASAPGASATPDPETAAEAPSSFDPEAPFGLADLDKVEVDPEVAEAFPEANIAVAARQGMETLETALSLPGVWEDRARTVQDYEPIRERLTPRLWDQLVKSVEEGAPEGSVAQVVAPGTQAATGLTTADGKPFTPKAEPPAIAAVAPTVHVVTDAEWFGDPSPRLELHTYYWLALQGSTEDSNAAQTKYRLDASMYFEYDSERDLWLLDGKHATAELEK